MDNKHTLSISLSRCLYLILVVCSSHDAETIPGFTITQTPQTRDAPLRRRRCSQTSPSLLAASITAQVRSLHSCPHSPVLLHPLPLLPRSLSIRCSITPLLHIIYYILQFLNFKIIHIYSSSCQTWIIFPDSTARRRII